MAQWAALRHDRKLDSQKKCGNARCGKQIPQWAEYCFLCAIFDGQRKINR